MKRYVVKSNNIRRGYKALLATVFVLLITLFAVIAFKPVVKTAAHAETSGSVTIHVYDSSEQYSSIAAWVWIKGNTGVEYALSGNSELFYKEYDSNGSTKRNSARTIAVSFGEAEMATLKSGSAMGLLICASSGGSGEDFWKRYDKETSDIFVDLSGAFDDNNHADVFYIRKDSAAYTNIEEAKMALEKVTVARFTEKTANTVTVAFEATTPIVDNKTKVYLKNNNAILATSSAKRGADDFSGTARFALESGFDFTANYVIEMDGVPTGASISKTIFIDDKDFISTFESKEVQSMEFGAIYSKDDHSTTFRVWAPFATSVKVNIYNTPDDETPMGIANMRRHKNADGQWDGVWEAVAKIECNGKYYAYAVNNYGVEIETIDPYAKACSANGLRGMVVNLDETDPEGWENDKYLYATNAVAADTPVVWEVHVSDFSASPDSGMKYKGKYLAFTETDTTVPGTNIKTGINYLKDLGITYVHLNPVYDFATVDESSLSTADNTKDNFNWGYDPQNYNIPEGSYSTDPSRGDVRINEFKQMVMALHNAGIGVIMDVVYNHTYSTGGQALHDTVPYYYHRTDANGKFTDLSGCGNDTASERYMMRKYMIDSLVYWATEYHIDGFRFDLMGVHDKVTIEQIRAALDKIDNGNGAKLLMYGEPWTGEYGSDTIPASYTKRVAATRESNSLIKKTNLSELPARVAVFNDDGRNGLRGNNDPGMGWVQGNSEKTGAVSALLGGISKGLGLGSRNVAYASAHDNYPLWDQLMGKKGGMETPLYYENSIADNVKRNKLVAASYLMSPGIAFMLAGEEMGRSKYGNHNSYNSPSKSNQIVWARQQEFSDLYIFYKNLIKLRKDNSANLFSYAKSAADADYSRGSFSANGISVSGSRGNLTVSLNAEALTGSVQIGTVKYTI